jgi:AraC family transcriptional regulator
MTPLDRMIPTLVHIQTHLDDDLKLEGLAHVAGVTPSHFSRSFTATIGESPHHSKSVAPRLGVRTGYGRR